MKVLVTGANGFIGSHLCRALILRGYQVRALVRATSAVRSLEKLELELIHGDILQPQTLAPACQGCEMIFHVAAVFAYWGHSAEELNTIAQQGTINILQAAHQAGVPKIILTSSSIVCGSSPRPVALNENHSPHDIAGLPPYVAAKIAQEKSAWELAQKLKLDLIAVCPTLTVGGPDFGLTESNRMLAGYLKDPWKATWLGGCNLVSVADVAQGHILAAEKGAPGERYILGGENLEWREVHQMISELCGLPGPLLTANHTSSYLAATVYEIASFFTGASPPSTRAQSKMVGQYYWYNSGKIASMGYAPRPARQALAEALSWLVTSTHISASLRAEMNLSPEIHALRRHD